MVLNEKSKRCGECVRRGYKCDVVGPSDSDWKILEREEERLAFETRITREAVATAMAKLNRLELQKDLLRKRGHEMLRRGLKSLDELDAAEEKERVDQERVENERVEAERSSTGGDPSTDFFSTFDGSLEAVPLSFWEGLDFDGGTPGPVQGR